MEAVRRRTQVFVIAVLVAATTAVVAACSSGSSGAGKPTTTVHDITVTYTFATSSTTTLPPAQLKAALQAYFAGEGAKLLTFERETHPFAVTGKQLAKPDCQRYVKLLSSLGGPNFITSLAQHAPDPNLGEALRYDVSTKHLYLAGCITGVHVAEFPPLVKRNDAIAIRALAKAGYPI